jgi:hypothetical protein
MAVDLAVTCNKIRPNHYREKLTIYFDNDGYYWFLHPFFEELYQKTGIMIDLYDRICFETEHLPMLKEAVQKALVLIEQQPLAWWAVYIGTQAKPTRQEIWKQVNKQKFLSDLNQFKEMINYALSNDEYIIGLGD